MGNVAKKSISVPDAVWSEAEQLAEAEDTTVSALVSEALVNLLALRKGMRALRDWERENGILTTRELTEADRLLDAAGVADPS